MATLAPDYSTPSGTATWLALCTVDRHQVARLVAYVCHDLAS